MRRREFMTLVGGAATWPLTARAQQPTKMKRVAIVHPSIKTGDLSSSLSITSEHLGYRAFFEELSQLGYVEGRNILVERYSGEGQAERFAALARDIVRTNPDVILAITSALALEFKSATVTIPLVTITSDPIRAGLAASIARPGRNITGVTGDVGFEIWGKRLGLLREAAPNASNIRFLTSRASWEGSFGGEVREAARQVRIPLASAPLESIDEAEYLRVFTAMEQDRVDGLIVSDSADHFPYRQLIVELVAKSRIPAVYSLRYFVELGGLMSYSFDLSDMWRGAADQIDKILKGANPGDIPYYQPTHFELMINLKTAKALGLELPPTIGPASAFPNSSTRTCSRQMKPIAFPLLFLAT
jgi:putative tryptophan/tyrosine transport system substrate-binding protein